MSLEQNRGGNQRARGDPYRLNIEVLYMGQTRPAGPSSDKSKRTAGFAAITKYWSCNCYKDRVIQESHSEHHMFSPLKIMAVWLGGKKKQRRMTKRLHHLGTGRAASAGLLLFLYQDRRRAERFPRTCQAPAKLNASSISRAAPQCFSFESGGGLQSPGPH